MSIMLSPVGTCRPTSNSTTEFWKHDGKATFNRHVAAGGYEYFPAGTHIVGSGCGPRMGVRPFTRCTSTTHKFSKSRMVPQTRYAVERACLSFSSGGIL